MKVFKLLFLCGLSCFFFSTCKLGSSICPSDWTTCQEQETCQSDDILYVCSNDSAASQGFKIGSTCFVCSELDECEGAMLAALLNCGIPAEDESRLEGLRQALFEMKSRVQD